MAQPRQGLIPLGDRAAWEQALEGLPHAFAHTWASCHAMFRTTGWPTFLYTYEHGRERLVCAVAERGDPGQVDVVTPYGFGGFVGVGVGRRALEHWCGFARENGWVCGYIGLNPELSPGACRDLPDYAEHNDVQILPLDRGLDALYADMSQNRRRQIRAFDGGPGRLLYDRGRLDAFFLENVNAFLADRGATAAYQFSSATLEELLDADQVDLIGVEQDDSVQAVFVFAGTAYCSEYLFGISTPAGRRFSAALLWAGAARQTELGVPRLNLGGGVTRGDGIAEFKYRFGGMRRPLGALKQVYRADLYDSLCREKGSEPSDRDGYFPRYRSPGPAADRASAHHGDACSPSQPGSTTPSTTSRTTPR